MSKPVVTEDMVTAASKVLREELFLPYAVDIRDFTDEEVKAGKLREADDASEEQNRALVRRALEAALATKEVGVSMQVTYHIRASANEIFAETAFDSQIGKIVLINFSETDDVSDITPIGEARLMGVAILDNGKIAKLTFEILKFDVDTEVPDAVLMRTGGISFAFKN